jgi:hypothetical protein
MFCIIILEHMYGVGIQRFIKGGIIMYQLTVNGCYRRNKSGNKHLKLYLLMIFVISLALFLLNFASLGGNQAKYIIIEVEKGDTLWGIVQKYTDDNIDPRKVINQIKKINGLNSVNLKPGQMIKLPF